MYIIHRPGKSPNERRKTMEKTMFCFQCQETVGGKGCPECDAFVQRALAATLDDSLDATALTALALETGKFGVDAMALLDKANTSRYGNPEIATVPLGNRKRYFRCGVSKKANPRAGKVTDTTPSLSSIFAPSNPPSFCSARSFAAALKRTVRGPLAAFARTTAVETSSTSFHIGPKTSGIIQLAEYWGLQTCSTLHDVFACSSKNLTSLSKNP